MNEYHLMKSCRNNEESLGLDLFSIENSDEWSKQNYTAMDKSFVLFNLFNLF